MIRKIQRAFSKNENFFQLSSQQKLREFNRSEDTKNGYLFKWTVWFDHDRPRATDIECYCTKHPIPLKLDFDGCTDSRCENAGKSINFDRLELNIESNLEHKYDIIKGIK
ncbi:hypothetical protein [Flavobacterium sp.]|uniref:hypothetical protein n=1 Tax=Flavobacterium sp. TaxID=239 RepID=UPI003342614B